MATGNRGKSGGARIIYYYYDHVHPIYALTVFTKNEQSNLSAREKATLAKLVAELKAGWRDK